MIVHIANAALNVGKLRWKLAKAERAARNLRAKSYLCTGPSECKDIEESKASKRWRRNHNRANAAIERISRALADAQQDL